MGQQHGKGNEVQPKLAQGINRQMHLRAPAPLVPIVASAPAAFRRRRERPAVQNGSRRLRHPVVDLARQHAQVANHVLEHARFHPALRLLYAACKFRAALGEALALAREANVYVDRKAPWFQIKEDPAGVVTTVYVVLQAVDHLKTILAPILPHTAQQLHEYLGYDGQLFGTQQVVEYQEETRSHKALTYDHRGAIGTWTPSTLPPGQALRQPAPLFKKLDESLVEEEYARLEG